MRARSPDTKADHGGVNESPERRLDDRAHEPAKPSKVAHFASGALIHIVKNAARMWLVEHLSKQLHDEPQAEKDESDLEVPAETAA
jgi:hypothetical protein